MRTQLGRLFPLMRWLPAYTPALCLSDALAAIVVALLLIPQALAYALLAGMPPETGLYASMLPLVAYAIWGTSRTLAVGPFAVVSIMTAAAISHVVAQTGADYVSAAVLLALLSGLMLLGMGCLRLGALIDFLSHPVISGFIAASGLLIAASQIGQLLGIEAHGQTLWVLARNSWAHMGSFHPETLCLGLLGFVWLIVVKRYSRAALSALGVPAGAAALLARMGPVLLVVIATSVSAEWQLAQGGVAVVGTIPSGLPTLAVPRVSLTLLQSLWLPALLLSVVTFAESISMAQTLGSRRHERVEPDQELIGLGIANMSSAFSGGFPVSASLSRSVVNDEAGAATPMAGAFAALGVAIAALFLMPFLSDLPLVVLAVIIIQAVATLLKPRSFVRVWQYSRQDGVAQTATLILTLLIGVSGGLMVGVGLSLVLYLYRTTRPHSAVVGRVPGTEHFRNVRRHRVETDPGVAILRIDESLYFGNARFLEDTITDVVAEQPALRDLVLMFPAVNYVDISAVDSLDLIRARLEAKGIRLHLAEVKGPVMDRLAHTEFLGRLNGQVFLSTYDAWLALKCGENTA